MVKREFGERDKWYFSMPHRFHCYPGICPSKDQFLRGEARVLM